MKYTDVLIFTTISTLVLLVIQSARVSHFKWKYYLLKAEQQEYKQEYCEEYGKQREPIITNPVKGSN